MESQGVGTFADIENGKREAILPVPYWSWIGRESEVAGILSANSDRKSIKFAWPSDALSTLMAQCLKRDQDWKAYYAEQMDGITPRGPNKEVLNLYAAELSAEESYLSGDYATAQAKLQALIDSGKVSADDKGWYLQEMARYQWNTNRPDSQKLQVEAHKQNRQLLKPPSGVTVAQLTVVSQGRAERIADWVSSFADYTEMDVAVTDILGRLKFGVKADRFEHALDELSRALGFAGERPDKEWKEGPDNLWALDDQRYLLVECKNEVDVNRSEINKREAEQMNRSSAWFEKHYKGLGVTRIIIHPAKKIESAAAFTHNVLGLNESRLRMLISACKIFFKSFENQNLSDLSVKHIQKLIDTNCLSADDIITKYPIKLKDVT